MLVICYTFVKHINYGLQVLSFATISDSKMKFRRREKQIGVRLRSDQHAVLKELAETEGYDSVSDFVRVLLDQAITEHQTKLQKATNRSSQKSDASKSSKT